MSRDNDHPKGNSGGNRVGNGGKRSKYRHSRRDGPIRWDSVEADLLRAAVDSVTEAGDAIVLARSGDGGVLSITVCSGEDRVKWYAHDGTEANQHLAEITTMAGGRADAL
jgi:hypothetical protein